MQNFKLNFAKVPVIVVSAMTVDSWLRDRFEKKNHVTKDELVEFISNQKTLETRNLELEKKFAKIEFEKSELSGQYNSLSKFYAKYDGLVGEIKDLDTKFKSQSVDPNGPELKAQLDSKLEELTQIMSENREALGNFHSSLNHYMKSHNIPGSDSTNFNKFTDNKTINTNTEQKLLEDVDSDDPLQMSALTPVDEFLKSYKEFLSTLSSEQLGCLSNALGFMIIFIFFTSIVFMQFGDYLINSLNLEQKYPKLVKYLTYRKNINNYSLLFNFTVIYVTLIIFFFLNIFMVFY